MGDWRLYVSALMLISGATALAQDEDATAKDTHPLPRPAMDERPGVIEIGLADGTRLRVDAFVNERALRRVLTVLRAAS